MTSSAQHFKEAFSGWLRHGLLYYRRSLNPATQRTYGFAVTNPQPIQCRRRRRRDCHLLTRQKYGEKTDCQQFSQNLGKFIYNLLTVNNLQKSDCYKTLLQGRSPAHRVKSFTHPSRRHGLAASQVVRLRLYESRSRTSSEVVRPRLRPSRSGVHPWRSVNLIVSDVKKPNPTKSKQFASIIKRGTIGKIGFYFL